MLKNLDYKVQKTEDCALIDVNDWVQPSEIEIQKINGKMFNSGITKVLDVHYHTQSFKENKEVAKGDCVLLTRVAADVAPMRSYDMDDGHKYFNLPITQILGVFKNNKVCFENLEMVYNKILIEKVEITDSTLLLSSNSMVGKVLKSGGSSFTKDWELKEPLIKIGDTVIVKDNIATEITLNGKTYYALEENNVVGIINYGFSLSDVSFINESILMKPYISSNVLNSSILITPDINYEDLDYSDIYNRDIFQIEYLDPSIKGLSKGDIIIVKRDYTSYVYFNQEKFFLLNGKEWIETKIERE